LRRRWRKIAPRPRIDRCSHAGLDFLHQVQDLPARIADLKDAGVRFRNEMEVGPGGKQVQIEDPDGNPIELFEPPRHSRVAR